MNLDPGTARPCTVDGIVARYKDDHDFAVALSRHLSAQDDLYAQMVISEMRIRSAHHEAALNELTQLMEEAGASPTAQTRARAYYSAHCFPTSLPAGAMSPLSARAGEIVRSWFLS
jgi:hypothetical protein